jgi:hypothetical protein
MVRSRRESPIANPDQDEDQGSGRGREFADRIVAYLDVIVSDSARTACA